MLVSGLITVLAFYAVIFAVGVYASWIGRQRNKNTEDVMLAGRSIGFVMGIFTMTGDDGFHFDFVSFTKKI